MEFLTSTILSGLLWDAIKSGISITADFLKSKLHNWIIADADYEKLAEAIARLPKFSKTSFDTFNKFVSASSDIQEVLKNSIPMSISQDNRYSSGTIMQIGYIQELNINQNPAGSPNDIKKN